MRIISGKFRGRVINPPKNLRARPTTDFAKENLFNVLANLIDIEDADVLDLFSGTGSVSLEFISRGAASVTSVEINRVHYNFIKSTAATFGIDNLYAVNANVFLYLKSCSKSFDIVFADAPYDLKGADSVIDMVLGCDCLNKAKKGNCNSSAIIDSSAVAVTSVVPAPSVACCDANTVAITDMLPELPPNDSSAVTENASSKSKEGLLRPEGLLIFEHSKEYDFSTHPYFMQMREYGSVHFSFFSKS